MQAKPIGQAQYFEGKRLKGDQTPHIYLVLDGVLRHIPNPETYNNLFKKPWNFQTISQSQIDELEKGRPLIDKATLFQSPYKPEVYLMDENEAGQKLKRHIASPATFDTYGFDWAAIIKSDHNMVEAIPTGSQISFIYSGQDGINDESLHQQVGKRLKGASTDAIYLVLDGQLRHIPNPETYNRLFNQPWQFDIISNEQANSLTKGTPLVDKTGLFRAIGKAEVYLLDRGENGKIQKRWIANPDTFNMYGFNWNSIIQSDPLLIEGIEDGPTINIHA